MILQFTLTMPGVASWDGKWTGEGKLYAKFRTVPKEKAEKILDGCLIKSFSYRWDDGWAARVQVKQVSSQEKRSLLKKSEGFCGYDWMIDNIVSHQSAYGKEELCTK